MLTKYLEAALRHAHYEILADDGTFYGEIPECRGVYANAHSLEECRAVLSEVLEDDQFAKVGAVDAGWFHVQPVLVGQGVRIHVLMGRDRDARRGRQRIRHTIVHQPLPEVFVAARGTEDGSAIDGALDPHFQPLMGPGV